MTPMMIAWLAAIAGGATAGKILGTFLRKNSLGVIGNPIVSLTGGVVIWQTATLVKVVPPTGWLPAALSALVGGGVVLFIASRFKRTSDAGEM